MIYINNILTKKDLANFYCLSTFYEFDNVEDRCLAIKLLADIREKLMNNVWIACIGESGHMNGEGLIPLRRRFKNISRDRTRSMAFCRACFAQKQYWRRFYGGAAWHAITLRWFELFRLQRLSSHSSPALLQEYFVRIDRLVDSCHNTGNVLDKTIHGINFWLSIKTKTKDPFWIVGQSSMRKFAHRRIKERFGWTVENNPYYSV